jgi:8-oxo-dGTP diphosphatase
LLNEGKKPMARVKWFEKGGMPRLRATLVAMDDRNRILLMQHVRPGGNYWVLPGGGVEVGESLEKTLEREILEELGVGCVVGKLVAVGELITSNRHVVDFFYAGKLERHDGFMINHEEGIGDIRWVEPGEIGEMNFLPNEMLPTLIEWSRGKVVSPVYLGKYNLTE